MLKRFSGLFSCMILALVLSSCTQPAGIGGDFSDVNSGDGKKVYQCSNPILYDDIGEPMLRTMTVSAEGKVFLEYSCKREDSINKDGTEKPFTMEWFMLFESTVTFSEDGSTAEIAPYRDYYAKYHITGEGAEDYKAELLEGCSEENLEAAQKTVNNEYGLLIEGTRFSTALTASVDEADGTFTVKTVRTVESNQSCYVRTYDDGRAPVKAEWFGKTGELEQVETYENTYYASGCVKEQKTYDAEKNLIDTYTYKDGRW